MAKDEIDQSVRNAVIALGLLGGLGGRSRKGWGSVTLERFTDWSKPESIEELDKAVENLGLAKGTALPSYTAFSEKAEVVFGKPMRNSDAAHRFLGETYRDTIKEVRAKPEREQFGLPRAKNNTRRTSPVFLHVHGLKDGRAIPVVSFLPAQFLEKQPYPKGNDKHIQTLLDKVAS